MSNRFKPLVCLRVSFFASSSTYVLLRILITLRLRSTQVMKKMSSRTNNYNHLQDKHDGYCLLYASRVTYGPERTCGFIITTTIVFSFLYAFYMLINYIMKIIHYNRVGYV